MAGLQRFITYIYKYENDNKGQNAGFAKIEIRGTMCRVEVHIRNISVEKPEATVYLFARNHDLIQGVPVGTMTITKGSGDVRYAFGTAELLNFGLEMRDMEGIFIVSADDAYLASQWKEGKIEKRLFRILEKKEHGTDAVLQEREAADTEREEIKQQTAPQKEQAEQKQETMQQEVQGNDTAAQQNHEDETVAERKQEGNPAFLKTAERNIQATELPLENFFEENGWESIFQKFRLKLDIIFPFEGKDIECVRMQLNDLREFPRKYWYIGNNSFLLHGFFNYRHIIFGEVRENGKKAYMIGVPGVFQNQERIMAAMFGFPEFQTAKTTEYKTGNFGYWYRII